MEMLKTDDEQVLLGCMLLENSIIPNVYNSLKPDAFLNATNKLIYETILSLNGKGVAADISTVYREVAGKGVDAVYVSSLTDLIGTAANWKYYADNVKNEFLKRSLSGIIELAKEDLSKNHGNQKYNPQTLIDRILSGISTVTQNVTGSKCHDMATLIQNEIDYIQQCISNKDRWLGLDTGYPGFNDIINGLQSVFMIIGARPSMGKTAFAQKMAMNISRKEKVLFIELEMSPRQLVERSISNLTQIPFRKIQSGFLTENAMAKLSEKMGEISQNKNFIPCEIMGRQLSDIVNTCRAAVRNKGVKVIFIDHIGLIRCNFAGAPYDKARFISNTLQQLQRELEVPIVVLSQLGRESEGNKNANLAAFRGSGAIEEDADICVFINRDRAEDENDTNIPTKIVIGKNRDGAVGAVDMLFRPEIVDFVDQTESYEERRQREEMEARQKKLEQPKPEPVEETPPKDQELFEGGDWIPQDSGTEDSEPVYDIF